MRNSFFPVNEIEQSLSPKADLKIWYEHRRNFYLGGGAKMKEKKPLVIEIPKEEVTYVRTAL
jgi:hypothetical protein